MHQGRVDSGEVVQMRILCLDATAVVENERCFSCHETSVLQEIQH